MKRGRWTWNGAYANEPIWRRFFMQILLALSACGRKAFKPAHDAIAWRNNEEEFATWCEGRTGYPLVDVGMRS